MANFQSADIPTEACDEHLQTVQPDLLATIIKESFGVDGLHNSNELDTNEAHVVNNESTK